MRDQYRAGEDSPDSCSDRSSHYDTRYAHADSSENFWAMALHLSVFASYLIPILGIVIPIVIWQVKKDVYPSIDAHGRVVVNGIISFFIFLVLCVPLIFLFLVGIPMMIVIGILAVVFPVVGGIKATNGEVWRYPLTINFV